ncbi:MAG: hypothetical protein J0L57_19290 [Burkholderiales bacterium]|nr:hypothetical protein [Burkholderiales bacterium]
MHRVQNANTNGRVGYCLDVLDLFLAKAWAGREKDRSFCIALVAYEYVDIDAAIARAAHMPLAADGRRRLRARILRWSQAAADSTKYRVRD